MNNIIRYDVFFYLQMCKFIAWMNYLYPANSILKKLNLLMFVYI